MSQSLKQKTVSGLFWSFSDNMANMSIQFVVGIILARLLSPREFGLIGMLTIFIAVSQTFIDSGFSMALLRKKECSEIEYSTVFYFNVIVSIFFSLILFFCAQYISIFFKEPQLKPLLQVLSSGLIIGALGSMQKTILTKKLDFKTQAKISVLSASISGAIGLTMAYADYGVWVLVIMTLSRNACNSFLLWIWTKWRPLWVFSKNAIRELFGFSSKILISALIDTAYRNIYYLVIGKYFSAIDLGYYTRAEGFKNLPSENLMNVIGKVSLPVLSSIQDDKERLKDKYKIMIRSSMFISFVLMLGLAAVAEPMVIALIGEKWRPSVIYLQMLCPIAMLLPLHVVNLNMLTVQGRSDLFLRLEIIKKALAIPVIIVGVFWGIKIMIIGIMVNSVICYFLNSYYSGRMIKYSSWDQIKDILPSFFIAAGMSAAVWALSQFLPFDPWLNLIILSTAGYAIVVLFCEIFKFPDYLYIKNIAVEKLSIKKNGKIE